MAHNELSAIAISALIAGSHSMVARELLNGRVNRIYSALQAQQSAAQIEAALAALRLLDLPEGPFIETSPPALYSLSSPTLEDPNAVFGAGARLTLSHIAQIAEVSESAVFRRALSLADTYGARYQGSGNDLSQENEGADKLRRAVATIVAELSTSKIVRDRLLSWLRFFDADLLRVAAIARPAFLSLPSDGLDLGDSSSLASIFVEFAASLCASDSRILAESSMGRGAPYGERLVTREFAIAESFTDPEKVFERVFDRKLRDGARESQAREQLCFRNEAIILPHIRTAQWIGINHALLNAMDWSFDPLSLRYVNANGEDRAQLLWWCDGQLGRNTRDSDDRSAFGWILLGAPCAMDEIRSTVGDIQFRCRVSVMGEGRETSGMVSKRL
jgi:hypothetical protein